MAKLQLSSAAAPASARSFAMQFTDVPGRCLPPHPMSLPRAPAGQEFARRKSARAGLKAALDRQAAELEAELAAGAAVQKRISQRELQIKRLFDSYTASQAAVAEAEDHSDLLANSLGRAADEAQRAAAAAGHLRAELTRRGAAVEAAQAKLEAARLRLQLEGQQLGGLQQKVGAGLAKSGRVPGPPNSATAPFPG